MRSGGSGSWLGSRRHVDLRRRRACGDSGKPAAALMRRPRIRTIKTAIEYGSRYPASITRRKTGHLLMQHLAISLIYYMCILNLRTCLSYTRYAV